MVVVGAGGGEALVVEVKREGGVDVYHLPFFSFDDIPEPFLQPVLVDDDVARDRWCSFLRLMWDQQRPFIDLLLPSSRGLFTAYAA